MSKICIYARESDDDTCKAPDISKQIEIGREQLKELGHELAGVYADNGYSGGDWNRPNWQQMVKDARNRNRNFDAVWCWNQDRLARDTEQFLWLYRNLKEAGIKQVLSGTEGEIDMSTAGGRFTHTITAAAAEFLRIQTSEKVRKTYASKKQRALKNGERLIWGRPALNLNMEAVKELRNKGKGWRSIAKELGYPNHVTIRNRYMALKNTPLKPTEEESPESHPVK